MDDGCMGGQRVKGWPTGRVATGHGILSHRPAVRGPPSATRTHADTHAAARPHPAAPQPPHFLPRKPYRHAPPLRGRGGPIPPGPHTGHLATLLRRVLTRIFRRILRRTDSEL
eukprot:scaffold10899_cov74-Isochrysis_galbana.AAC.1